MGRMIVKRLFSDEIDPRLAQKIDACVNEHRGTVFHETAFNRIASQAFETRLSYYLAREDGRILGVMPCHTLRQGIVRHNYSNLTSYEIPYGGWVYDSGRISLDELLRSTRVGINETLHIASNIELDEQTPQKSGFLAPREARTVLLKLGKSDEELFTSFKHSQKNKIRKAIKLGVKITRLSPGDFDRFYGLVVELKENVNKQVRAEEYFGGVFKHYHALGRACCLVAEYGGEDISTLLMLANKPFATIWMGGRKMGIPNSLYQNELMIWEAIKWANACGSDHFDLCVLDEARHSNLARMKLSFSKDVRKYYFYHKRGFAYRGLNRLQRAVK